MYTYTVYIYMILLYCVYIYIHTWLSAICCLPSAVRVNDGLSQQNLEVPSLQTIQQTYDMHIHKQRYACITYLSLETLVP